LRYYVWLPLLRIADMWLRPRTELLPLEARWWNFDDDPQWIALTLVLGVTNLLYIAAALLGLVRGRFAIHLSLLLIFVILRSAFLGTLENPEPRYTLECYPVVILLAASLLGSADFRSPLETAHVCFREPLDDFRARLESGIVTGEKGFLFAIYDCSGTF
jgi:hypothetical protein